MTELPSFLKGRNMYDPGIGRWLTQDPIGFRGGDSNLYRYCDNSPVNHTDPSGLDSEN